MNNTNNNRRIFKNTLFLYFRMSLTLVVTLYTSRVVLNTLGVEDFGIYNVVGGVVTMMAFLSGAMSSATQRFLSFELGRNDTHQLHHVFKMSINIHLLIVLFVVLVAETLGLWFINNQLVIPVERLASANIVFHCALFSFCCTIISVPYNALIISHERMSAFAYISIIDVMLKLVVAFLLMHHGGDKLEYYSYLLASISLVIFLLHYSYVRTQFENTRFNWYWDVELFKSLSSYTGWNLFGNLAVVMSNQGANILLNVFFGASVNAARAVAIQVNSAIMGFVSSLQVSINPQIIKSFSINDIVYMHELIFSGARYTFYLLLVLACPIFIESDSILKLWLGDTPEYANYFVQLILIESCVVCLSGTLMTSAQATGNIKLYQAVVGGVQLFNVPISFYLLTISPNPLFVFYVSIILSVVSLILRLIFLKRMINLSVMSFFKDVILPSIKTTIISIALIYVMRYVVDSLLTYSIISLFLKIAFSLIISSAAIFFVGLNKKERHYFFYMFTNKLRLRGDTGRDREHFVKN